MVAIDPEQQDIFKEGIYFYVIFTHIRKLFLIIIILATEARIQILINFLLVMKFNVPEDQVEEFTNHLMAGNKDVLQSIIFWCLQRFEHLQKRAYLSKYLTPIQIPGDFMGEDLIIELSQHLKSLQNEFKEVHKTIDQLRADGARPGELKAEIAQLESERTQLQSKIAKLKKDAQTEDPYFHSILKGTYNYFTLY